MLNRYIFIIIIFLVTLLAIAEFLIFPNLYSTIILLLIIILLLLACFHIIREEKRRKEEMDYFHLIVHELKSPLSAIKLSLRMLLSGSFGMLNSEQHDILGETEKKNETLIGLTDNLLDYSKSEIGSKYNKHLVDIVGIIERLISQHKNEVVDKHIEFIFQKPSHVLPQVMADKNKITIAIQNLIENAIHYTPMYGKIIITASQDNGYFQFAISDTGIGIPEDDKQKIFSKFFRAHNAVKTEVPGSGLGLFITKKMITGHHGRVWFTSKEHEGSTFYFKVPI